MLRMPTSELYCHGQFAHSSGPTVDEQHHHHHLHHLHHHHHHHHHKHRNHRHHHHHHLHVFLSIFFSWLADVWPLNVEKSFPPILSLILIKISFFSFCSLLIPIGSLFHAPSNHPKTPHLWRSKLLHLLAKHKISFCLGKFFLHKWSTNLAKFAAFDFYCLKW